MEIIGVKKELHRKVLSLVSFGIKAKCWFCKKRETTNRIRIWNRKDSIRLCSECSVDYTNQDFTKLLERITNTKQS